jgi:4-diphosphocytidyl-2-C-methyl-D-erythritol kinase
MYPVPWCDVLEIVPSKEPETTLTVTGKQLDGPFEKNLCYRAWSLMAEQYRIPAVNIHLHKVIPSGAGLGGGSSDASFTLKMLNSLFALNLDNTILQSLAVQLGMDCPFFIENIPALSSGRGEILEAVPVNLEGLYLFIIKPEVHVSTAAAFTGIKPIFRDTSIKENAFLPVKRWREGLHNDFEKTVFGLYPEIEEIKNKLYRNGALYAALSGSGSAVYGLFSEHPGKLDFPGSEVFMTLLGSHP